MQSTYKKYIGKANHFFTKCKAKNINKKGEVKMEMTLNNGFCEMTQEDLLKTEGGGGGVVLIILLALIVCGTKGCADADAGK